MHGEGDRRRRLACRVMVESLLGLELLWLLLPVAAGTGWWAARSSTRQAVRNRENRGLRSDYFQGINYLLNEQPDKAIEVFIKLIEVDSETVETHLALGNLYRRRGDVDRAIRIHQNLIARESLSVSQRTEALLELGQDYMSAGLLDRAEDLFSELAEDADYRVQALRQLIDIYEQEKDWPKAIASARKLEKATGNQLGWIIAHYCCEQAGRHSRDGDLERALKHVQQARNMHGGCVRASLLEADIHVERNEHERAIHSLQRVEEQDPDFLPETVGRLHRSYRALDRVDALDDYLSKLMNRYGWTSVILTLADIRLESGGRREAVRFITEWLRQRASVRGLDRLLDLEIEDQRGAGGDGEYLEMLKGLTAELLHERPVYKCRHCGFPAKSLHWQCPSCKHWTSIRPIQGVEGE